MNALTTTNADAYRASTDAASLCKAIVVKTALDIQGRKYVRVEGWQSIAIAHGCTASATNVQEHPTGVSAVGEIRRMSDGVLIATAEGFVGADEPTWYGGTVTNYGKTKTLPKRPDYAIRAMAQTRAISRACRTAFAHVVVMMDAGLSTTPAEEVPYGGFQDDAPSGEMRDVTPPKIAANGVKRLSSARAKELGLHDEINAKLDGCKTLAECDAFDERFDKLTEQAPISWLDAFRNRMILHREDLEAATIDSDEEQRQDARGNMVSADDGFPGDRPAA